MSYRLIDANAIAESYPDANDMPCIYADLPRGLDGGHYDMREPSELQRENAKLREQAVRPTHPWSMGGGDFYIWYDPETMTTTVREGDRTEQVSEMVGEALAAMGRYIAHVQEENDMLRKRLTYLGDIKEGGVE